MEAIPSKTSDGKDNKRYRVGVRLVERVDVENPKCCGLCKLPPTCNRWRFEYPHKTSGDISQHWAATVAASQTQTARRNPLLLRLMKLRQPSPCNRLLLHHKLSPKCNLLLVHHKLSQLSPTCNLPQMLHLKLSPKCNLLLVHHKLSSSASSAQRAISRKCCTSSSAQSAICF